MKKTQALAIICVILIIIIAVIIWFLNRSSSPVINENRVKELAWNQISKEVKDVVIGDMESGTVARFRVDKKFKDIILNNKIFDYNKYSGKMMYCVTYMCKKADKTEPYLIYIDPDTEKVVATNVGFILLD